MNNSYIFDLIKNDDDINHIPAIENLINQQSTDLDEYFKKLSYIGYTVNMYQQLILKYKLDEISKMV